MDFAYSDEQQAIVDLAAQILGEMCAPEKLREVESGTEWFHRDAWAELGKADLLGLCLPEAVGGGGYGFLEACLLLQQVGKAVAPVPLYATLVLGALPIAELGTEAQKQRWLPGVIAGDVILTGALNELDSGPRDPQLQAKPDGDGWKLHGTKTTVPAFHLAQAVLVPARADDGAVKIFIVATDAAGLSSERQDTFNHEPVFHLDFDGVAVGSDDVLGGDAAGGEGALAWIVDRAVVGLCAIASGVSERGMRLTADYVTNRKQFDRPIGSFQAVGHRMADCYIDNEAIRLTMLQAATQLAEGKTVDAEIAVAKYWASYGGSRVGHADLHLHGGISIDLDYPIHRYFLWAKHLENTLGAATPQLATIGAILAATPVG
ncbi:MAG: acyl-CoA/acyl-ACP dehydrogenase [Actinobacteria bacterium]|nr:acyl-CoA/acyl-ACP dehydrogenase [Actinomycetota bacterium]